MLKRLAICAQGGILRREWSMQVAGRVRRPDVDQTFRFVKRQSVQDRGINQTEDGSVGADAERESEDSDDGEAGRFTQLTDRVAEVLK